MIDLLVDVAKANPEVLTDPGPRAYFTDFGDSSLDFKLRVWVDNFDDGHSTRSDIAALAASRHEFGLRRRDLSVNHSSS